MATPRTLRPATHPFPVLLYLEWALLGMAMVSELSPTLLPRTTTAPAIGIISVGLFGLLGLRLPTQPTALQIGHVIGQFAIIVLASHLGLSGLRLLPLLYIVLVIRSCLMFALRGRLVVTAMAFLVFVAILQNRMRSLELDLPRRFSQRILPQLVGIRLNLVLMFAIVLIFVLLLVNALLSERERREELRRANQKLRESAAQIERLAMTQERSRIAREIHDALGHSLTGLNIQLEGALKFWQTHPDKAHQFLAQAKTLGSTALQEVRQAVSTLRGMPLHGQELRPAIAGLCQHFQDMTGVCPRCVLDYPPLPPALQVTVYRIVQEALTNTCKYAQASAVDIVIRAESQPRPGLSIMVQDNGVGFRPEDNSTGFGIQGIKERSAAEGGQCHLISAPGEGCTLQVWLPLASEER